MQILEHFAQAKGDEKQMEDLVAFTPDYIAVFDGATPKTAIALPNGLSPGQYVADTLAKAISQLAPDMTCENAVTLLSARITPGIGEASGIIYSSARREIWSVGDCQCAMIREDGTLSNFQDRKLIDEILSQWRADIIRSMLSRGICTPTDIQQQDSGRKIIQPFITRQVRYQNLPQEHRLAFGVFDGKPIPERFIRIIPVPEDVREIILASDGYPQLAPTLQETEILLQQLLQQDPLCIGPLAGTKGIKAGNASFDDRTYVRFLI